MPICEHVLKTAPPRACRFFGNIPVMMSRLTVKRTSQLRGVKIWIHLYQRPVGEWYRKGYMGGKTLCRYKGKKQ